MAYSYFNLTTDNIQLTSINDSTAETNTDVDVDNEGYKSDDEDQGKSQRRSMQILSYNCMHIIFVYDLIIIFIFIISYKRVQIFSLY